MQVDLRRFYIYSTVCRPRLDACRFVLGAPLIVLPGVLLAGAIGLPRWFVSFRRGRG